jgi:hypothetical protein
MDRTHADNRKIAHQASRTFWRQTVLTSCVLAVCLAVIALLAL